MEKQRDIIGEWIMSEWIKSERKRKARITQEIKQRQEREKSETKAPPPVR